MIQHKNTIAAIALLFGSGLLAHPAMAAAARAGAQARQGGNVIVIEHGIAAVRPLYSPLCEYKTVMSNLDMQRCGVFLYGRPAPSAGTTVINPRAIRVYR